MFGRGPEGPVRDQGRAGVEAGGRAGGRGEAARAMARPYSTAIMTKWSLSHLHYHYKYFIQIAPAYTKTKVEPRRPRQVGCLNLAGRRAFKLVSATGRWQG